MKGTWECMEAAAGFEDLPVCPYHRDKVVVAAGLPQQSRARSRATALLVTFAASLQALATSLSWLFPSGPTAAWVMDLPGRLLRQPEGNSAWALRELNPNSWIKPVLVRDHPAYYAGHRSVWRVRGWAFSPEKSKCRCCDIPCSWGGSQSTWAFPSSLSCLMLLSVSTRLF